MSISIEKISYQNQKDLRILESVLLKTMTIRVMPKNEPAKRLYEKKGFEVNGTSKWGSLMMEKKLI